MSAAKILTGMNCSIKLNNNEFEIVLIENHWLALGSPNPVASQRAKKNVVYDVRISEFELFKKKNFLVRNFDRVP